MSDHRILFNGIDERVALDRDEGDVAYFNALMLKLEYVTKVVVSGVVACIGDDVDRHRYTLEHKLVRADSMGNWAEVLNTALVGPPAQASLSDARFIARDLTEQVGSEDWRHQAVNTLVLAAEEVGVMTNLGSRIALRQFFDISAQIRNRTRGHGATKASECNKACPHLDAAIDMVVQNAKIFRLPWVHLHQNLSGKYRVSPLLNDPSPFEYLKKIRDARLQSGVYFHLNVDTDAANPRHVPLIITSTELNDIALPNGNFKGNSFETLSYVTNDVTSTNGSEWSDPPARLPPSETEGDRVVDDMENVFGNVPPMPSGYVSRLDLESRIVAELSTIERHPIVTLTGPGGIGKTTIAIKAIREVSNRQEPPFNVVLWLSARDIDLRDDGPKPVSRRVFTQKDISREVALLMLNDEKRNESGFNPDAYFQACLADGVEGCTLFVFDNFETLQNPVDVFEWLDAHIRPPNKVLITTRFRDFRGDYPIQIKGMLDDEANELINQHAKRLGIDSFVDADYRSLLIGESDGHPYVIKILLGQAAKAGRAVKPERIVANADHLLDALFKRTFDALSAAAQRIFMLLCSWRVFIPEVAIEAVALRPGTERFDVSGAIEEVIQFSLADYTYSSEDEQRFIGVPLAAALYGQRELQVSSFKIAVEEDRKLLMGFGAGKRESSNKGVTPRIENFIKTIAGGIGSNPAEFADVLPVLEYLARRFPKTYLRLADLVLEVGDKEMAIDQAKNYLRRFLESAQPAEKRDPWLNLADLCARSGDSMGEVHAFCEVALLPTSTLSDLSNIANNLNSRIRNLKDQSIQDAWSPEVQELLMKVIQEMERKLDRLSATDCSRLAWLHLNVGNSDRAMDVASLGITKDPTNDYCKKLIAKLN